MNLIIKEKPGGFSFTLERTYIRIEVNVVRIHPFFRLLIRLNSI